MKKKFLMMAGVLLTVLITACGNNNDKVNRVPVDNYEYEDADDKNADDNDKAGNEGADDIDENLDGKDSPNDFSSAGTNDDNINENFNENFNENTGANELMSQIKSGNDKADEAMELRVVLLENEEIEGTEWVEEGICYRVMVQYIDTPEDTYKHKKDYFVLIDDYEARVLEVNYPAGMDFNEDRCVYGACDFEAKLEDVNFDGTKDVVISLGHAGAQGANVYCAYIDMLTVFIYCPSFEDIANYELDTENKLVISHYKRDAYTYMEASYEFVEDEMAFVLVEEHEEE